MKPYIKTALVALSLGTMSVSAMPAQADPGDGWHNGRGHGDDDDRHGGKHWRGDRDRDRGHDRDWRDRDDRRRYAEHRWREHERADRWRERERRDHWRERERWRHNHGYYGRPRTVYVYDWDRPDPRYRHYYADRYYRGGYAPMRVTRGTRIYRGYDDRYYCRRSDGTTGLIIGATLGGLLGHSLDRGGSSLAGTLIGAGAGAMLGREIDRGDLNCR